jgi:hypothetical protein
MPATWLAVVREILSYLHGGEINGMPIAGPS